MDKLALRIASSLIRLTLMGNQMSRSMTVYTEPIAPTIAEPSILPEAMPTTAETVEELERRLAKELYRMELDLANGGRIAGKPCDCLSKKHHFGIEATAEELLAYKQKPVYNQVLSWLSQKAPTFEPAEIAKRSVDYYHNLIPEVRRFRKEIMGTENPMAMLTVGEKKSALDKIKQEIGVTDG